MKRSILRATLIALLSVASAHAAVVVTDPTLPVTYDDSRGVYLSSNPVFATYNGTFGTIQLLNVELRALHPITLTPLGPNEQEQFSFVLLGDITLNSNPSTFNTSGPGTTEAFGKVGNTTGTFNTEMLQMDLSGSSGFGPLQLRESPTLPSTGQSTITDIGGGQFNVSSFFDVFTELSVDGGATWNPSQGPPSHVDAGPLPEPSTMILFRGACLAFGTLRRNRRQGCNA